MSFSRTWKPSLQNANIKGDNSAARSCGRGGASTYKRTSFDKGEVVFPLYKASKLTIVTTITM